VQVLRTWIERGCLKILIKLDACQARTKAVTVPFFLHRLFQSNIISSRKEKDRGT